MGYGLQVKAMPWCRIIGRIFFEGPETGGPHMEIGSWITIALVCATGAASPGPSLAVVLKNTVAGGRSQGILTGLGHGLGVGIYAFGAVVGVSALVASNPGLGRGIEIVGALYLLWMGTQTLRHAGQDQKGEAEGNRRGSRARGAPGSEQNGVQLGGALPHGPAAGLGASIAGETRRKAGEGEEGGCRTRH